MAIIRIKRTTGFGTPIGLTFGELAFVQGDGSGGRTANRLYIADNRGVCVWIGAEILNSPTYWSGATAETTVPTVGAVEGRIVAGGAITFANNLTVNIADGKYFGKYKKNDVIPALGQTVKWVIEDALSERVVPVVPVVGVSPSSIERGRTSGTITVTVGYTIKTAGATATGTTLEYRWGNSDAWTLLDNSLKNNNSLDNPYQSTYSFSYDRTSYPGRWSTANLNFRYSVHDTNGLTGENTGSVTASSTGDPSVSFGSGPTAASLRTGVLAAGTSNSGTETDLSREKGNTYTTVNFTVNRANQYIPLISYTLQAREYVNGSYGSWSTIKTENISSTSTRGITYSPVASGASLDKLQFKVLINDEQYDGAGSGPGTTYDVSNQSSEVLFNYMVFFGATTNVPTTSTDIRGLSSGIVIGTGVNGNGGGGSNQIINPFFGLDSGAGAGSNTKFIIAVPDNVTITELKDEYNGSVVPSTDYPLSTTLVQVNDRNGAAKNYNVYIMNNASTYEVNHNFKVTRTGSVSQP